MNDLAVFKFQSHEVRTVTDERGEPWFVAKDVCDVLGVADHTTATRDLESDEKGTHSVRTPGGDQSMLTVSESGLYALIFKSRKPDAKVFRKWVTSEVLPAIRRDGGYMLMRENETPEDLMARALVVARETLARSEQRRKQLEIELDKSKEWYTVKRMEKLNPDQTFPWQPLKRYSVQLGYPPKKVFDQNYGTVNAYHKRVWEALYYDALNFGD